MTLASRTRLERAALEAFGRYGYRKASTKRIAEAAGMNEASLFRLFGTKSNLFYSAIENATISIADLAPEAMARSGDFSADLRRLVADYLRLYIHQMPIYRMFMVPLLHDPEINHRIFAKVETLIRYFTEFLDAARAGGEIVATDFDAVANLLASELLICALELVVTVEGLAAEAASARAAIEMSDLLLAILPITPPPASDPLPVPPRAATGGITMPRPSGDARDALLAAARRIFARDGFALATVRDIASEAGLNQALLFRHFNTKEALFLKAIEAAERDADNDLTATFEALSAPPPPAAFAQLIETCYMLVYANIGLLRMKLLSAPFVPVLRETRPDFSAKMSRWIATVLDRWGQRGARGLTLDRVATALSRDIIRTCLDLYLHEDQTVLNAALIRDLAPKRASQLTLLSLMLAEAGHRSK